VFLYVKIILLIIRPTKTQKKRIAKNYFNKKSDKMSDLDRYIAKLKNCELITENEVEFNFRTSTLLQVKEKASSFWYFHRSTRSR
jgi:hypothetical protein